MATPLTTITVHLLRNNTKRLDLCSLGLAFYIKKAMTIESKNTRKAMIAVIAFYDLSKSKKQIEKIALELLR